MIKIRKAALFTVASFALAGATAQAGDVDGFVSLFDGKTLNGWVHASGSGIPESYAGGEWAVQDGAIAGRQKPAEVGTFLHTEKHYGDFELELEVNPDWGCDSGIWIRTNPSGKCIQVFVDYLDRGNVGFLFGQGTGGYASIPWELAAIKKGDRVVGVKAVDKYDGVKVDGLVYSAGAEDFNRVWRHGEFNTLKIRCEGPGPRITTWVNGVKMMEMDGATFRARGLRDVRAGHLDGKTAWSSEEVARITGSRGTIALQVHPGPRWTNTVLYKNIRIREIAPK